MTNGDPNYYSSLVTDNTATTITAGSYYYDESSPNIEQWKYVPMCPSSWPINENNNNKGDDDMRYLYEVILVNPEDENFEIFEVVAKNETSALMQAYEMSDFSGNDELNLDRVEFDELKTHCRVLMEWKKEKSLEKALETIKKAVE